MYAWDTIARRLDSIHPPSDEVFHNWMETHGAVKLDFNSIVPSNSTYFLLGISVLQQRIKVLVEYPLRHLSTKSKFYAMQPKKCWNSPFRVVLRCHSGTEHAT